MIQCALPLNKIVGMWERTMVPELTTQKINASFLNKIIDSQLKGRLKGSILTTNVCSILSKLSGTGQYLKGVILDTALVQIIVYSSFRCLPLLVFQ